jgi:hypothetical protein
VNEASVNDAREILEKIQANFPILMESRTKDIINGMKRTLDAIAASPQRVPTSATAQLEKAVPILRGIASGAKMEEGYDELIEDALAGLEACRVEDEPEGAPSPTTGSEIPFDNGDGETPEADVPEPVAVPVEVSGLLCRHSAVVAQLTPRVRRLSDLYAEAYGSENGKELLQKISGLLELQTRALQDVFSLNCDIAIFPIGKIKDLSGFLDFQLVAMGACSRHARVLEKTFKKHPHRKRFWQLSYFLRIAIERQIDELSGAAGGDDEPANGTEFAVPAPL